MMKTFKLCLCCFCILLFGCKDKSQGSAISEGSKDPADLIEKEQAKDLENAYFYILAPNGLSLRKSDDLKSEKILTIPFGAKVKQMDVLYTADFSVENIQGSMMEVLYDGKEGYVFSGYLSRFPVLNKGEETKDYIVKLKSIDPEVLFEEKDTDPDFHEGTVETITLPATEWHEVFYLAKAMYAVPNSLNFPGHEGVSKETINQKDREEGVWRSALEVSRNATALDTIKYFWRGEISGYFIIITQQEKASKIEYTAFVD